jgi:predicted DNA-binding transcriptional regulator YafY
MSISRLLVLRDMKRPLVNLTGRRAGLLLTRPPLDRMQRIFQAIKQGKYPNRIRLATDIEVTTKTIQRDLDFMRDRWNMPIAYNDQRQGYEFTQPVENFPMVELSEAELISVYVAQKALTQYKGTPFEHPLRSAFEKLISELDGKITLSWDDLDTFISFRNFEIVPADLKTFRVVSEAVRKSATLEFEYKKLNASAYEKRVVEPYHLACIQNQWYCFGRDLKRGQIRTFVLARMRYVTGTGQTFIKLKGFSLGDYLKDSLGVFSAKGKHRIRIRFDPFAAQLVRERIWHSSQQIQELTGGGLEFRVTLSSLHEIEPWVLSWGEHAHVLGPSELTGRLMKTARKQLTRYR